MRTAKAPRGLALDTVQNLTRPQLRTLYGFGVRLRFGYVDRVRCDPDDRGRMGCNIIRQDLEVTLGEEMCFSPVQYYSTRYESTGQGARLSEAYGRKMGLVAAHNCEQLGLPPGIAVWLDLESFKNATPEMILDYATGWGEAMIRTFGEPACYYGAGLGSDDTGYLTGRQLRGLPYYRSYWRAASAVPQVTTRGACVTQGTEQAIRIPVKGTDGTWRVEEIRVDFDLVALDHAYQADKRRGDRSPGRFLVACP